MVKFIGRITRCEVNALYGSARAGIVLYQPAENHYKAQPIKLFEFMAAGLPVVASNFPLWESIIEHAGCGICVDPTNASQVKDACLYLLDHPRDAQQMGNNGRLAVLNQYNWDVEEEKLLHLYSML